MAKKICVLFCFILLTAGMPLLSQVSSSPPGQHDEPFSFIGMKLDELVKRFGPPQTVFSARGSETWQDDVVFVYDEGDFYIYLDRVWQVGVKSVYGIKTGDAKTVVMLVLGEGVQDRGDHLVYPFYDLAWPLSLRVNFGADRISAIFVYRSDY
jgi:hypothetical protein